ncbi:hypothetical protein HN446_01860 [bacterium]|nr:hypothetical protein [bacterium]
MNFKKSFFVSLVVISLFSFNLLPQASEEERKFLEEFDNDTFDENLYNATRVASTPEEETLEYLQIVADFIAEPLYKKSNELNSRFVTDLPHLRTFPLFKYGGAISMNFFYNKTNNIFLTESSPYISSYLNLEISEPKKDLGVIFDSIDSINYDSGLFEKDLTRVLPLVAATKVEERRAGFMIQGLKKLENINLGFKVPLYYTERNYYFTDAELERLEAEPLFRRKKTRAYNTNIESEEKNVSNFQYQHFVSDKIGFGDARIMLGYQIKDGEPFKWTVGAELTLPTAFLLSKGVIGKTFLPEHYEQEQCTIITENLVDYLSATSGSIEEDNAASKLGDDVQTFSFNAIDRLASMLLESPLGNNNHVELCLYSQFQFECDYDIILHNNTSISYIFPKRRKRFFVLSQNQDNFPAYDDGRTASQTKEYLKYYENHIVQKFFPEPLKTTVWPGIKLNSTSTLEYKKNIWSFCCGVDFWLQTKERLSNIEAPKVMLPRIDAETAKRPFGFQAKLLGAIKREVKECSWWKISADITCANSGIGKDYSLMLEYGVNL